MAGLQSLETTHGWPPDAKETLLGGKHTTRLKQRKKKGQERWSRIHPEINFNRTRITALDELPFNTTRGGEKGQRDKRGLAWGEKRRRGKQKKCRIFTWGLGGIIGRGQTRLTPKNRDKTGLKPRDDRALACIQRHRRSRS